MPCGCSFHKPLESLLSEGITLAVDVSLNPIVTPASCSSRRHGVRWTQRAVAVVTNLSPPMRSWRLAMMMATMRATRPITRTLTLTSTMSLRPMMVLSLFGRMKLWHPGPGHAWPWWEPRDCWRFGNSHAVQEKGQGQGKAKGASRVLFYAVFSFPCQWWHLLWQEQGG